MISLQLTFNKYVQVPLKHQKPVILILSVSAISKIQYHGMLFFMNIIGIRISTIKRRIKMLMSLI